MNLLETYGLRVCISKNGDIILSPLQKCLINGFPFEPKNNINQYYLNNGFILTVNGNSNFFQTISRSRIGVWEPPRVDETGVYSRSEFVVTTVFKKPKKIIKIM